MYIYIYIYIYIYTSIQKLLPDKGMWSNGGRECLPLPIAMTTMGAQLKIAWFFSARNGIESNGRSKMLGWGWWRVSRSESTQLVVWLLDGGFLMPENPALSNLCNIYTLQTCWECLNWNAFWMWRHCLSWASRRIERTCRTSYERMV